MIDQWLGTSAQVQEVGETASTLLAAARSVEVELTPSAATCSKVPAIGWVGGRRSGPIGGTTESYSNREYKSSEGVHRSQWIRSKGRIALKEELGKGNLMCRPCCPRTSDD